MVFITDKKILIVEDEVIIALELEYRLKAMGYRVCGIAATGEKAILLVQETKPNLVLMDINLRGAMNGIQTADIIKDDFSVPSIYLTAYSDDLTINQIKRSKNHDFLFKPYAERELQGVIEKTIGDE